MNCISSKKQIKLPSLQLVSFMNERSDFYRNVMSKELLGETIDRRGSEQQ
ncbi:MAG: hypothetical protein HeimC2_21350 [Candidatus Heimdallarchaeota archaeon LC_2]|nr:MAG: hypothetical protein HeimC2_21350 [Candidatus Heimdallarchaeota archaeon LC_2]